MSITLREYQQDAVNKIIWASKLKGNDLLSLPTGAGKSIVISEAARALDRELLIFQPSKEILEQNLSKLRMHMRADEIGVFSASMPGRNSVRRCTLATIGSVVNHWERFEHIENVMIDEAHLVDIKKSGSMYNKFLRKIGNPKVFGFTATPYRNVTASHPINEARTLFQAELTLKLLTRMQPFFWNRLLVNVNISDLIAQNYLCPLDYEDATIIPEDEMVVNAQRTDFDLDAFDAKITKKEAEILHRIQRAMEEHKSILVFCSSVKQAEKFASIVPGSYAVSAKTKADRRDSIIEYFKSGDIKIVFNVGVLTTGFDHPALDCIVLIRPTRSLLLYYQILGRGVRIAEGKTSCKVIDFSGTVKRLGPIETIRLDKDPEDGGKWQIFTSTGRWHNRALYSYTFTVEEKKPQEVKVVKKLKLSRVTASQEALF